MTTNQTKDNGETVTIQLAVYDRIRDELRAAHVDIAKLQQDVQTAKLGDNDVAIQLLDAFHESVKIVQFAVANLDPATIAGWPHAALTKVADAIATIPGINLHVSEVPPEFRSFATRAAAHEAERTERKKTRIVLPATAADFGPKTAEAQHVHETLGQKVIENLQKDPVVPEGLTPGSNQ